MKFKYTICLPDKSEIQYFDEILNRDQILENAKKYPWISQLELTEKLGRMHTIVPIWNSTMGIKS